MQSGRLCLYCFCTYPDLCYCKTYGKTIKHSIFSSLSLLKINISLDYAQMSRNQEDYRQWNEIIEMERNYRWLSYCYIIKHKLDRQKLTDEIHKAASRGEL